MNIGFNISGEYITDYLRDLFIESDFNKVYEKYLGIFNIQNPEYLVSILKGKEKFIGKNEFDLVVEDRDITDYLNELERKYKKIFKFNDNYYRMMGEVEFLINGDSYEYALSYFNKFDIPLDSKCEYNGTYFSFNELRAHCVFLNQHYDRADYIIEYKDRIYGFKRIGYQIPFFIDTFSDIDEYISLFSDVKIYVEKNENIIKTIKTNTPEKARLEIIKRSKNKFINLLYKFDGEEKVLKIPEIPFHIWCISTSAFENYSLKYNIIREIEKETSYECVLPSGMKMMNDNQYHSDWIVGAGLNLDEWYDYSNDKTHEYYQIDTTAYEYMFHYVLEMREKYEK